MSISSSFNNPHPHISHNRSSSVGVPQKSRVTSPNRESASAHATLQKTDLLSRSTQLIRAANEDETDESTTSDISFKSGYSGGSSRSHLSTRSAHSNGTSRQSSDGKGHLQKMSKQDESYFIAQKFDYLRDLPTLPEDKQKKFDKALQKLIKQFIERSIKENFVRCNNPNDPMQGEVLLDTQKAPNPQMIEKRIKEAFLMHMRKYADQQHDFSDTKLKDAMDASRNEIKTIWENFQKTPIILKDFIPRLKAIRIFIHGHMKENKAGISEWTKEVFKCFKSFEYYYDRREYCSNPAQQFIDNFSLYCKDEKIRKIVGLAFEPHYDDLLALLKRWANPDEIVREFQPSLLPMLHDSIRKNTILDENRVFKQTHEWLEPLVTPAFINDITITEVKEAFVRHQGIQIQEITINDNVNILEYFSPGKCAEDDELFQIFFFTDLFSHIYACHSGHTYSQQDIQNQATILCLSHLVFTDEVKETLKRVGFNQRTVSLHVKPYKHYDFATLIPWNSIGKRDMIDYEKLDHMIVEWSIPCFPILRLCSNSVWLKAHDFLVKLYPALFQSDDKPRDLHSILSKEIRCHIQIDTIDDYDVTQIKSYEVFKKINRDPKSRAVDKKNKIGTVQFSWMLTPNHEQATREQQFWRGFLKACNLKIETKANLLEFQTKMMETLADPINLDRSKYSVTTHWDKD